MKTDSDYIVTDALLLSKDTLSISVRLLSLALRQGYWPFFLHVSLSTLETLLCRLFPPHASCLFIEEFVYTTELAAVLLHGLS